MKVLLPRQFYFSRADREGAGGRPRAGKRGPALHRAASAAPRAPRPVPATGPRSRSQGARLRARSRVRRGSSGVRHAVAPECGGPAAPEDRAIRLCSLRPLPASKIQDPNPRAGTPSQGGRLGGAGRRGLEEPRSRGPGAPSGEGGGGRRPALRLTHLQTRVRPRDAGPARIPASPPPSRLCGAPRPSRLFSTFPHFVAAEVNGRNIHSRGSADTT